MQRTFRGLALAAVFALSVPWLHADHPTTITLQSGERLSGRFADLHNDLVYLRVSQHEEPRIPLRDIARIEFTEARPATPSGTRDSVRGEGPHRLVLRNGREIAGRFEGLTGDDQPHTAGHPLEFVFSTASGEYVRVNADRIARIELAPLPESPGTATGNVTIRLDDGTSMRGDLRSLDANGLAMGDRVNGGDRRYSLDQVAVIDFGDGTAAAADRRWSPRGEREPHLLVMRNGREVSGEFLGGTRGGRERDREAYLFRSAGNGRIVTFTPATASRLYLGGSVSNGGFGFSDKLAGGVEVLAQRQWISTGLQVRRGETLQFTARGEVQLSTDDADRASPRGAYSGRGASGAPVRSAPAGALIGRVGSTAFLIGEDSRPVRMPAAGELFLGVNDDHMPDNRGSFTVTVNRPPVGS